jgi:acylphosphatase
MLSACVPNPADESVKITAKGEKLQVFDMMGKLKQEITLSTSNAMQLKLNTSTWENGTYVYRVVSNGKTSSALKMVISH